MESPGTTPMRSPPSGPTPLSCATGEHRELLAQSMDIPPGWEGRPLRAVVNYGEIYQRNVGRDSPLKI